jgi:hypothetical protein
MLSKILLKSLHILSLEGNESEHSFLIKFDFGVEKVYKLVPDTFKTLIENKTMLKNFVYHSAKYELEQHIEKVY